MEDSIFAIPFVYSMTKVIAIFYYFLSKKRILDGKPCRHSSIYAVNVGTHKNKPWKQKPPKSRLLSSTKGEENRLEL